MCSLLIVEERVEVEGERLKNGGGLVAGMYRSDRVDCNVRQCMVVL